ncbi:hypothetical protein D3C80_1242190 [compost metagenome]
MQVQGLLQDLGLQGAVRLFDGFGHGVEAHGQLSQLIRGAIVDPGLEVAPAKALGCLHQLLQRSDHAVLQFVQANQQDDHGGEQGDALDHLLPGLLVLALALQQADEPVQLFDEGQGAGLKRRPVATDQGRMQCLVPVLLDLLVAALQVGIGTVFQHRLE